MYQGLEEFRSLSSFIVSRKITVLLFELWRSRLEANNMFENTKRERGSIKKLLDRYNALQTYSMLKDLVLYGLNN